MNWPREMIWLLKEKIRQLYYPAIAFSIAVIAGILSILCFNLRFGLRYPFSRRHWLDDVFIVWSFPAVSWATRTVVVLRNDNEIHSRKKYLQISAQKDGESERDRTNERTRETDLSRDLFSRFGSGVDKLKLSGGDAHWNSSPKHFLPQFKKWNQFAQGVIWDWAWCLFRRPDLGYQREVNSIWETYGLIAPLSTTKIGAFIHLHGATIEPSLVQQKLSRAQIIDMKGFKT